MISLEKFLESLLSRNEKQLPKKRAASAARADVDPVFVFVLIVRRNIVLFLQLFHALPHNQFCRDFYFHIAAASFLDFFDNCVYGFHAHLSL